MGRDMKFRASFNEDVSKGIDDLIKKIANLSQKVKEQGDKQVEAAKKTADQILAEQERLEKQRIALQRNSVALEDQMRTRTQAEYERWWQRQLAIQDNAEKQRIALQRNSLALAEAQQAREQQKSLQNTKYLQDSALRIERQAEIAESALTLDKFERRIAVERAKHAQILSDLKGNDAAQEAEIRRHNAVVARIQMDQANFPNTPFQQLLGGMKQSMGLADGAMGMAGMAAGALGAALAISKIGEAIHGTMSAALEMQTLRQTVEFAAGGAKEGAEAFQFLQHETDTLGISLRDAGPEFARMKAAAIGTSMAGKVTNDTFHAMSEAAVVLHMNTDMSSRSFYALQEMMSMGTVQTRQLRQLTLALPGAFQDAAKAMGTTTQGLEEMMKKGQVMTDEFMPKFAQVLHEKYGAAAVEASENARQSMQKFKNLVFETSAALGGPLVDGAGLAAKAILAIVQPARDATQGLNAVNAAANQMYQDQLAAIHPLTQAEKEHNKALEDGLRLAKEAQAQEAQKNAGPTSAQEEAIKQQTKADEEAKKKGIELKFELEQAKIESTMEGIERQIALEDLHYRKELQQAGQYAANRELIEQIHQEKLVKLQEDAVAKANKKFDEEQKKSRDIAIREDEKNTNQLYAARDRLAEVSAKTDMDRLIAKQQKELELYQIGSKARTIIEQAQAKERERLREQEQQAEIAAGITLVNNIGGALQAMAGKNRALAKAGMRISEAGAIASTAAGVMKAFEQGGVLGFLTGAGIAAEGIKQVETIESQMNKFAQGTDYAPGGMALVGEQGPEMVYLPRGSQVKTASETSRMMGPTLAPNITIHMAPGTTAADAHAIADTIDARLRSLARDLKEIDYRGIRA